MVTFGNSRCAIPSWLQVSLFRTARSSQGRAVGAAERTLDGEDWSERIKRPGNWTRVGVLVKSREHAPVFFGKRRHPGIWSGRWESNPRPKFGKPGLERRS